MTSYAETNECWYLLHLFCDIIDHQVAHVLRPVPAPDDGLA